MTQHIRTTRTSRRFGIATALTAALALAVGPLAPPANAAEPQLRAAPQSPDASAPSAATEEAPRGSNGTDDTDGGDDPASPNESDGEPEDGGTAPDPDEGSASEENGEPDPGAEAVESGGGEAPSAETPTETPAEDAGREALAQGSTAPPSPVAAAAEPLPGQSDQPAPPSKQKRVIENVHTDTVSAYLDSGRLVLQSKADVDGETGKRFDTESLLFHLEDNAKSKVQVPAGGAYDFIGKAGDTFWLAPQTQDHTLIWPGFSTEDPALSGKVAGNSLKVRLLDVEGPGKAELYLQDALSPRRVFSSTSRLPDWTIGVPQHTHMNWAFTRLGTYTLTFEMEGTVDGKTQKAQNSYTFVVGDLEDHTVATATSFEAEYSFVENDPEQRAIRSEPVTFTATVETPGVTGRPAVGAVQFRDLSAGTVLGHAPVGADGTAKFRTSALPSGEHRIIAEFVPSWSDDFTASSSEEMPIVVDGEAKERPTGRDSRPVPESVLSGLAAGDGVVVTSPSKAVRSGGLVTGRTDREELRGDWVSVWLHAASPVWLGWVQTSLSGDFSATVPKASAAGKHRLVLKDRDGNAVGWDRLEVTKPPSNGGGGGGGSKPPPTAPPPSSPTAPVQECVPDVTLDHGHIDAFNVSAGGGSAVLQLKEDVTGHQVIREAETVLLQVKESAYGAVPPGIAGAPAQGYVLPLTQDPNLVWPGWDTNRTAASGYRDVSINIMSVEGPGTVFLATQGSFGGWTPILDSGFAFPGTIREPEPAHTHAQWVFAEKGVYKFTVNAVATDPGSGASLTTATHTYVFQVGDVPLGDAFCGVSVDQDALAAAAAVETAVRKAGAQAVAASQKKAGSSAQAKKTGKRDGRNARGASNRDGGGIDGALDALLGGEMHPAAIAGVVGGTLLLLGGIVGGTIWYVRRVGASAAGAGATGGEPRV